MYVVQKTQQKAAAAAQKKEAAEKKKAAAEAKKKAAAEKVSECVQCGVVLACDRVLSQAAIYIFAYQ